MYPQPHFCTPYTSLGPLLRLPPFSGVEKLTLQVSALSPAARQEKLETVSDGHHVHPLWAFEVPDGSTVFAALSRAHLRV